MTITERNEAVVKLRPLARRIALKMAGRLPPQVDRDDLVSEATLGLMQAVEAWDPARGTSLRTYAGFRIRGAVLDWLRKIDPLTRPQRAQENAALVNQEPYFEGAIPEADDLPGHEESAFDRVLRLELRAAVENGMAGFTPQERAVARMHLLGGRNQNEVGAAMQLDPSRISQIHTASLAKLRAAMGPASHFVPDGRA